MTPHAARDGRAVPPSRVGGNSLTAINVVAQIVQRTRRFRTGEVGGYCRAPEGARRREGDKPGYARRVKQTVPYRGYAAVNILAANGPHRVHAPDLDFQYVGSRKVGKRCLILVINQHAVLDRSTPDRTRRQEQQNRRCRRKNPCLCHTLCALSC